LQNPVTRFDGVMIPFKTKSTNLGMGDVIMRVKEVKHNQTIDDKVFNPKKWLSGPKSL
jgi:hypothetical protein